MSKVETIGIFWDGMAENGEAPEAVAVSQARLTTASGRTAVGASLEDYDVMIERIAALPSHEYIDPLVEGVALPSTDQHGVAEGKFEFRS